MMFEQHYSPMMIGYIKFWGGWNMIAILLNWFQENFMKLNKHKCHLVAFSGYQDDIEIKFGQAFIEESYKKKFPGDNLG